MHSLTVTQIENMERMSEVEAQVLNWLLQLTGTYGTLTLASDGTYTYVADQSAADDLDAKILQPIVLLIQYQMERQLILQH